MLCKPLHKSIKKSPKICKKQKTVISLQTLQPKLLKRQATKNQVTKRPKQSKIPQKAKGSHKRGVAQSG